MDEYIILTENPSPQLNKSIINKAKILNIKKALKDIVPDRDYILNTLDCRADNPIYHKVIDEYKEVAECIHENIEPVAVARCFPLEEKFLSQLPDLSSYNLQKDAQGIYRLVTLLEKPALYCSDLFDSGYYLKGLIADALFDNILFQLNDLLTKEIKKLCCSFGRGIQKVIEAPKDFPIELQKRILDILYCEPLSSVSITSGYMYSPVKTMSNVMILTEDTNLFQTKQDCSKCNSFAHCKWRIK